MGETDTEQLRNSQARPVSLGDFRNLNLRLSAVSDMGLAERR